MPHSRVAVCLLVAVSTVSCSSLLSASPEVSGDLRPTVAPTATQAQPVPSVVAMTPTPSVSSVPATSPSAPLPSGSPAATPPNVPLSPAPSVIDSVLIGTQVWPVEWNDDGSALIAVDQTPGTSIVHVFDADGHEIWSTSAITAAWTGADSLAFLRKSDTTPDLIDLFEVKLPSGAPTQVQGSYLNFITPAANGRLAVPTSETPRGFTFDLLNPAGGHFDGEPLLWSPAADKLAIIRGSATHSGFLAIVDAASGSVTRTRLDVAEDGLAFDRSGSKLMACVYGNEGNCIPTLVAQDGTEIVASVMRGELLGAGELPDGRWVGGNPAFGVVVWDPNEPATTTSLGTGWSSVSPTGTVAIIGDATVAPANIGPEVALVQLPGSGDSYPVWSPAGDLIAYSVLSASGQELRIARVP